MIVAGVPAGGLAAGALEKALARWAAAVGAGQDGSLGARLVELHDPETGHSWSSDAVSLGLAVDLRKMAGLALGSGRERTLTVFDALAGLLRCSARGATVAPAVALDHDRLAAVLGEIGLAVNVLPTNASLDPGSGRVREGHSGRLLEPAATEEAIGRAVMRQVSAPSWTVPLCFAITPACGDVVRLASLDRSLLGAYTTSFSASEKGRSWNIALAAARLDGTVIEPGDTVSFNGLVGAREPEAGFREAPEIVNNELVPGFGGGVCQVASTLFNAALFADLDVVERYHHSRPLSYVGLGRDATVSYPNLDLVVRNSRAFPVILTAWVRGGQLTVSFWGRRTISTEVRIWAEEVNSVPARCLVEVVPDLPPGTVREARPPFDGRDVRLWRQVYQGGRAVRTELIWVDHYEPITGLVQLGPGASAGATAEPADGPGRIGRIRSPR